MDYDQLATLHLASVLPAFVIGTLLLRGRKGTPLHKKLSRIYLPLMIISALITLLMPARVGPALFGHFGFIHSLSLLTLYAAPSAYLAARRGNIQAHRKYMIGLYIGGLLIAGSLALMPGRMLHKFLFSA